MLLIAENTLSRRLQNPSYASLRGRITFSVTLTPLTKAETEQFIKFRLLKCGSPAKILTEDAYGTVQRMSGGIPREINRLLYNGFLEALTCDCTTITTDLVQSAGLKLGLSNEKFKQPASAEATPQ